MDNRAILIVHTTPLALGGRVATFEWDGPASAPVLIRGEYLCDLGVTSPDWPDRINVDGYPLKLIPGSQHDSTAFIYNGALYARVDGLNRLSWLRWSIYRKARAFCVGIYYRFIITLHVWNLASYQPNRRPSWRDIGKK